MIGYRSIREVRKYLLCAHMSKASVVCKTSVSLTVFIKENIILHSSRRKIYTPHNPLTNIYNGISRTYSDVRCVRGVSVVAARVTWWVICKVVHSTHRHELLLRAPALSITGVLQLNFLPWMNKLSISNGLPSLCTKYVIMVHQVA